MKTTKLFVVLDEETLNTMKGFGGKTAKFETEEEADKVASESLGVWTVVKVHFTHGFIHHTVK
tara:strand:- start:322 stop:510 length:189 start_codon:yes stop_codon:yes gene_type:complete